MQFAYQISLLVADLLNSLLEGNYLQFVGFSKNRDRPPALGDSGGPAVRTTGRFNGIKHIVQGHTANNGRAGI